MCRRWQLSPPTVGLTCDDHRQPGSRVSLPAKELRRRHLPVTTQIVPLLERGQAQGIFRDDVSPDWLIAVVRAIVHVASTELQVGRLSEVDVEQTMLTTAFAAS